MIAATDLLQIWETGLGAEGIHRTVLLHAAARPNEADLFDVPVGERDADLFALRQLLFGPRMPVRLRCPACGAELEFDFDTRAVAGPGPTCREPVTVQHDGWTVTVRLPTSADLLALTDAAPAGPDAAAGASGAPGAGLLARCLLRAERNGEPVTAADLPAELIAQVAAAVAAADERADIRLDVRCPDCDQATRAELDIAACLWAELDAWAHAALLDVHLLGSMYGWSEPEILALSPLRRRYYLELAGHA